jgi:hypothetical protein
VARPFEPRLENRWARKRPEGSNPSPAAQPRGFLHNDAGLRRGAVPAEASVFVRVRPPISGGTGEQLANGTGLENDENRT